MKMIRFFAVLLLISASAMLAPAAHAQTEVDSNAREVTDTLSSQLLNEFTKDYDVVFKSTKKALEDLGYAVNYASKKRNLIETDFKVLVDADGDFDDVMSLYGDIPYMRSPGWTVGRTKVTVSFEQLENGKVAVKVLALMSGYEARFTNLWHYWKSNGKVEQEAMDAISATVEGASSAQ